MMRLNRLTVCLQCIRHSFRQWRASDAVRTHTAGFLQVMRSFVTSNGNLIREPNARPVQEEIVNALLVGERCRASHLLSELGRGGQALQAADFISILQHCAKMPDPLFAMETWNLMEEKDIELSDRTFFLAIRALCKGGYLKEAFHILRIQRENSDICRTLPVYNNMLEACVQTMSLTDASECLNMMEQQGVGKNGITYTLLLKSCSKTSQQCVKFGMSVSAIILRVLLHFGSLYGLLQG